MQDLRNRRFPVFLVAANLLIFILWLWLYRPVFPYLGTIFTRGEFRINQIVLLAVLVLLGWQIRKGNWRLKLSQQPKLHLPALILTLGGSALFIITERYLDINTLSASLFALASYGLLGLWMQPSRWRQGLPATILLVGALPFGEHMQTFIGYPVRVLTASIVEGGLSTLGVSSATLDTILVFENGITQVDLPCSGVKSLWTGGMFLIAVTWIDRRPLNYRWGLVAVAFVFLLLVSNLLRVGVLVSIGMIADWKLLAEMLHVPLGVLGFIGACALAVVLLRWVGDFHPDVDQSSFAVLKGREVHRQRLWLIPLLLGAILILILTYSPRPQKAFAQAPTQWEIPAEWLPEIWPLTPGELEWLSSGGALAGDRWRFEWRGHTGSILLITSDSWRAHHRPERCFQVYGLTVQNSYSILTDTGFPVRFLALGDGSDEVQYSAMYWFQSSGQTTDDYATRIWSDLDPDRETWVLATILMDEPLDPNSQDMQDFYPELRNFVERSLEGGQIP